jgi:hypothetical protein
MAKFDKVLGKVCDKVRVSDNPFAKACEGRGDQGGQLGRPELNAIVFSAI